MEYFNEPNLSQHNSATWTGLNIYTSRPDKTDIMEDNLAATFDAGSSFNTKLRDTLQGLLAANNDRKGEIEALRGDHETLKSDHEALVNTTERENSLR